MKIIIALDSFKGTLSAIEACRITAEAIRPIVGDIEIVAVPMADGGEGTANAIIAARNGRWIAKEVTGPLPGCKVTAGFGWFEHDCSAIVEMASASGLELLKADERNPLKTTTYGTGELIAEAVKLGCGRLLLAVGGSATVDGGVGAAMALGWRFLDKNNSQIGFGGAELEKIEQIIVSPNLNLPIIEVLCDVGNPLCGSHGAAKVFGPQKGATPQMVTQLEAGLCHLADIVSQQLGREIDVPGAGAAGGLAAGAAAFMNAKYVSGIEAVIECTGLAGKNRPGDWVITGEGCFDNQSLQGKVVFGVAKIATDKGAHIGVLAGSVNIDRQEYEKIGIIDAVAAQREGMTTAEAMADSEKLLARAARNFAKKHLT